MSVSDTSLQQAVLDELEWEPSVDAAHIGVTANNGVVTLTGHVDSYSEKWAAEQAAGRVTGVKAVAVDLDVRYPSSEMQGDDDIAKRALQVLSWDIDVPADKVKVEVEKGWITLSGDVDWNYQRSAAAEDVRKLNGVIGVSNNINIKPHVQASDVRAKIKAAFARNAEIEDGNIVVTTDGSKVTLSGTVETWTDRDLAETTAWSAPGVTQVDNRLAVA